MLIITTSVGRTKEICVQKQNSEEFITPHIMVTNTELITEYSTRDEFSNYSSDQKILACHRKIAQLSCELLYYKNQLLIQSDGVTTKKGRL